MTQTILRSGRDAMGNVQRLYDANTLETVRDNRAVVYDEDFISPAWSAAIPSATLTAGWDLVRRSVLTIGTPSTVLVTAGSLGTGAGGVIQLNLSNTSEAQEASLYGGDVLAWGADLSLTFEARVNLAVLPSIASVQAVWGMSSAIAATPDGASYYIEFGCTANGAINYRTKDGVNTVSTASGVTVVAGAWHVFRIDATDATNIIFSIDGVATGGFAFAATGTTALLQPMCVIIQASRERRSRDSLDRLFDCDYEPSINDADNS